MNLLKKLGITVFLISQLSFLFAQSIAGQSPAVGKKCPDFMFDNISYFTKRKVKLNDFKGQYLILDFWDRYCTACVQSFPKLNELSKDFKGKVQIMLVGKDNNPAIREIYDRFRQKLGLVMPVAYDTVVFRKFAIGSVPYILWIDPSGIVKAITTSTLMTEANVAKFVNGTEINLPVKNNGNQEAALNKSVDLNKAFLSDNFFFDTISTYRSVLTPWTKNLPNSSPGDIEYYFKVYKQFEVLQADIPTLYRYACFGWVAVPDSLEEQYYEWPIIEVSDSSSFQFDYDTGKNLFCYSLIVPYRKGKAAYLKSCMQNDLKNYFGYDARVETRIIPCWKLVATKGAAERLKTKGGTQNTRINHTGGTLTNIPIKTIIQYLWAYHQADLPFINATGISTNIDITIDALLTDLTDIKRSLLENGLDLIQSVKEMKVIVIRDPPSNAN